MSDIITVALDAAREAGSILLDGYGKAGDIRQKADRSLVTRYDRLCEEAIVSRIRCAFPRHRIVAEEGGQGAREGEYCWVIDPLDGTHNFIRQIGAFGVSIGVLRGSEFVAGVIFLPREDELYVAQQGAGATRNGSLIRVSTVAALDEVSLCFDSSIRGNPQRTAAVLADAGVKVFNVRMFGSSVRTLTHLAEGKVDGVLEFDDKPWDFAAGVVLVREAGGKVSTLEGAPMGIDDSGYVASNGRVHEALRACVTAHRQVRDEVP